jgi:hypothetical protein
VLLYTGQAEHDGNARGHIIDVSFIKLVETNPCLWNFTLESYSRTDLTTLAWRKIAAEFNDTGKEV